MLSINVNSMSRGGVGLLLSGALDGPGASRLRDTLSEMSPVPLLHIDLTDVSFADSVGFEGLTYAIRWARQSGGEVTLSSARPWMVRLLATTGFDKVVRIVPPDEDGGPSGVAVAPTPTDPSSSGGAAVVPPDVP